MHLSDAFFPPWRDFSNTPLPVQHRERRLQEDVEVEERRPVFDIPGVEADLVLERKVAAAGDLREPGDARRDGAKTRRGGVVFRDLTRLVRRGPMSDMSPRKTFQNRGSSSTDQPAPDEVAVNGDARVLVIL